MPIGYAIADDNGIFRGFYHSKSQATRNANRIGDRRVFPVDDEVHLSAINADAAADRASFEARA